MEERIKHWCKERLCPWTNVTHVYGHWQFHDVGDPGKGDCLPITYCPYCGEKLEPPDVKIEVSRKMLESWRKTMLHSIKALDAQCPLQNDTFCELVCYAFGDAHTILSALNNVLEVLDD